MSIGNPFLLWGALGIVIPILIHLWNKKESRVLDWAATQWLLEKNRVQQRNLKLDNLLLLLVRCLLITLLAFLLSEPAFHSLPDSETSAAAHLIEPDSRVVENFRYELQAALDRKEPLFWIDGSATPVSDLTRIPTVNGLLNSLLQASVDKVERSGQTLNLYLQNSQKLVAAATVFVHGEIRVHSVTNTFSTVPQLWKTLKQVDALVSFQSKEEEHIVGAALVALRENSGLPVRISFAAEAGHVYDLVLTDRLPVENGSKSLLIVSGYQGLNPAPSRMSFYPERFTIKESDMVRSGGLPEWIAERLLAYYDIIPSKAPLSQMQLNAVFRRAAGGLGDRTNGNFQSGLLIAFIVLLIIERAMAFRSN